MTSPSLLLSPHPDDAVLSAWTLVASDERLDIVNICSAAPPPGTVGAFDPLFGVTDSHAFVAERLAEDEAALAHVGHTARGLGFLDEQYRTDPLSADDITSRLNGSRWSRVIAPAALGGHPDHVVAREAAAALAVTMGCRLTLYADFPYAVRFGWPSWVTGAEARPNLVPDALWPSDFAGSAVAWDDLSPEAVALDEATVTAKLEALQCYESQFEGLNAGPMNRLHNPEIIGFELFFHLA